MHKLLLVIQDTLIILSYDPKNKQCKIEQNEADPYIIPTIRLVIHLINLKLIMHYTNHCCESYYVEILFYKEDFTNINSS